MGEATYRVKVTKTAKESLRRIGRKYGKKTYEVLRDLILDLSSQPEKKGEPLRGLLHGLYSRHYSRFRIIYSIDGLGFVVIVVATGFHETGSRADVYKALQRLIESGMLDLNEPDEE